MVVLLLVFFFKQKTAYEMRISDWSSDVCSSDLIVMIERFTPGKTNIPEQLRHLVELMHQRTRALAGADQRSQHLQRGNGAVAGGGVIGEDHIDRKSVV